MSELESATQPILRPLMRSERSIESLSRAERHTLARWAAKTAFMLDAGGLEARVSVLQLKELFVNAPHLPENVYVFAHQQPCTRPWYYIGGAWWKHPALEANALRTVQDTSYKIALQFGDVILIVVFWPLRKWGLRVEHGDLSLLWPATAVVKRYEHPEPQDITASDDACRRFAITIGVVPHFGAEGFVRGGAG